MGSSIDREALLARLEALAAASGRLAAHCADGSEFARKAHVGIGLYLAIGEVKEAPEVVGVCAVPARRKSGT